MMASATLDSGLAWKKFVAICDAQGGFREPPWAPLSRAVEADRPGRVTAIDNRRIAQAAKLAGAPDSKAAGITMKVRLEDLVESGQPLFTLHAETQGEMAYAQTYLEANPGIVTVKDI